MIFPDRVSARSSKTPPRDESQTGLISELAGPSNEAAWEVEPKSEAHGKPRLHWQEDLVDKVSLPENDFTHQVHVWDDTMGGASNKEPIKHFIHSHSSTPVKKTKGSISDDERVLLNVGGVRHETHVGTLQNVPGSRLSRLADLHKNSGRGKQEYFFDRHPSVFNSIIDFYRTGQYTLS